MKQRHYIDFKLYLTRSSDGQSACQVSLLPTTEVGESRKPVTISTSNAPSQDLLSALANKSITQRQLVELGKQLADCLLPVGEIRVWNAPKKTIPRNLTGDTLMSSTGTTKEKREYGERLWANKRPIRWNSSYN
jgi:hypothetical protein